MCVLLSFETKSHFHTDCLLRIESEREAISMLKTVKSRGEKRKMYENRKLFISFRLL